MFKILRLNENLVLSPKQDIHTTPSDAQGIRQKKEEKYVRVRIQAEQR